MFREELKNINSKIFDIYYLKGDSEEVFEPMFTYHGYRYIHVSGITKEQATSDLLTYLVISSDICDRGNFECSDERANKIYEMGRRSDRSNFIYFPLDCPHREKNGWTGDASLSAEHMIMTMDVENSWREWLLNLSAAQHDDGDLPGICPTDSWGYGFAPAWDSALFELPYMAYKYRGETKMIEENASSMLRYLEFASKKRDERGIADFGKAELAYDMITRPEFPSYGYWLDKGETTMLETFHEYDGYYGSSKNHHFLGDVVNWFMSKIGGIRVQNPKHVKISPCFIKQLDFASVSYNLPDGEIKVSWKREDGKIKLFVDCPEGVATKQMQKSIETIW